MKPSNRSPFVTALLCANACVTSSGQDSGFGSGQTGSDGTPTAGTDTGRGSGTDTGRGSGTDGGGTTEGGDDSGGSSGGIRFDVGSVDDSNGGGGGDGGNGEGCKKIDFLFVVDNSGSMEDEHLNLTNSFPGFISAIQDTLDIEDYHILVTDSDEFVMTTGHSCVYDADLGGSDCSCQLAPLCCEVKVCPNSRNPIGCNGRLCQDVGPPPSGCDVTLGAGRTQSLAGEDCGITGGSRYMLASQPGLGDAFGCLATVGTYGDDQERPMAAMIEAVSPALNGPGGCNDGFIRDDAILVVTYITDEPDNGKSPGGPASWKQALVDAKNGDEQAIVVLGLVGDTDLPNALCERGITDGAEGGPRLRSLAGSFPFGQWASVCEPDYSPFFQAAVGVIDSVCDDFVPPG